MIDLVSDLNASKHESWVSPQGQTWTGSGLERLRAFPPVCLEGEWRNRKHSVNPLDRTINFKQIGSGAGEYPRYEVTMKLEHEEWQDPLSHLINVYSP